MHAHRRMVCGRCGCCDTAAVGWVHVHLMMTYLVVPTRPVSRLDDVREVHVVVPTRPVPRLSPAQRDLGPLRRFLGAFASDIANLSRIVTLNNLSVVPAKDGSLTMDATAKTFRYLDSDEVAAQRKAIAPKGAKK